MNRKGNIPVCIIGMLLAAAVHSSAQQGIRFTEKPWDSLRVRAAREHLMIFMDVYTDWCRPCRLMDEEVFSQQLTGDFFNHHFINYRMNAEKGEGRQLATRYGVPSYPCYLFVDPSGKLVYRSHGFCNGDQLVALARTALKRYQGK